MLRLQASCWSIWSADAFFLSVFDALFCQAQAHLGARAHFFLWSVHDTGCMSRDSSSRYLLWRNWSYSQTIFLQLQDTCKHTLLASILMRTMALQYPPISSLHLICPRSIRIKQVVSGNKSISHLHFLTMPSTLLFDKRSQCNFYLEGGAWGGFHRIGQWHPLQHSCLPAQSTLEGFGKQVLSLRLQKWHICVGSRINQAGCVRFRCHILGWNFQVGWSALMDLWSGMTSHSLVSWCQCLRWAWRSWPCSQTSQVFSHLRLHFHWVSKPGGMSQTSGTFFPFSGSSFQMHVSWFNGGSAKTLACNFPKSFASVRRWQRSRLPRLCAVVIEKHSKQLMADLACLCSHLRHAGFVSKTCDWHLRHRPWPFDLSETKSLPHDVWSWGCHMKGLREQNLEWYEVGQSMMEKLFCVAVLLCNSIKQLRNPSSPLRFHLKDSNLSLTNAGSFKTFRRRER